MPDYKGKTKAEVRAIVLANNKNRKASDKGNLSMNNEIKRWQIQNRDLSSKKTSKSSTNKPKVKKIALEAASEGFSNYGQTSINKELLRDETYSDYAREIRGEAPAEDLYKTAPITKKRGFKMPGYGKRK